MLQQGDKAPNFKGINQNGDAISLKDYKGKKLVIYFYPADDTPTCTKQACNLRDNYSQLLSAGISLIGISPDDEAKHKKFIAKYELPFPLLADKDTVIAQQFGVWGPKTFMGKNYIGLHRTTFLINEKGLIAHVISKPTTKAHAEEILAIGK
jgi:peroxiredoxin Q/BCP